METGRSRIRLLFVCVAVYFTAGLFIRKYCGEFYPALNMPSFAGVGLQRMTTREGEMPVAHIHVVFADRTQAEATPRGVFGNELFPPSIFQHFFARDNSGQPLPLSGAAVDFLRRRLQAAFPGRNPISATLIIQRESFPLTQPHNRTVVAVEFQRQITFP